MAPTNIDKHLEKREKTSVYIKGNYYKNSKICPKNNHFSLWKAIHCIMRTFGAVLFLAGCALAAEWGDSGIHLNTLQVLVKSKIFK